MIYASTQKIADADNDMNPMFYIIRKVKALGMSGQQRSINMTPRLDIWPSFNC